MTRQAPLRPVLHSGGRDGATPVAHSSWAIRPSCQARPTSRNHTSPPYLRNAGVVHAHDCRLAAARSGARHALAVALQVPHLRSTMQTYSMYRLCKAYIGTTHRCPHPCRSLLPYPTWHWLAGCLGHDPTFS